MQIVEQITFEVPADRVWNVVAHEFSRVGEWASGVHQSSPIGDGGAVGAGRACRTSLGTLTETFTSHDEAGMRFTYRAAGMPFVVREATNAWSVTALGPTRCRLDKRAEIRLLPLVGLIVAPVLKRQMGQLLHHAVEELKHFVETGEPHPRKRQATVRQPAYA